MRDVRRKNRTTPENGLPTAPFGEAAFLHSDPHLTDEQFSDLLAGDTPDSRVEAHLAACADCHAEAASLRSAMGGFNDLSMAWAEREAPRRVQTPSRWTLRLGSHPVWSAGLMAAATAAALVVGFHMPLHGRTQSSLATTAAAVGTAEGETAPSRAELAADNHLLASIDQELNYEAQPTVPVSQLRGGAAGRRTADSARGVVAN